MVSATEAALDLSKVLTDWSADERSTLLERPLFGFASYGRVRFHHRSVVEYLAAKRLDVLLSRGISIKAIKRLLFVETAQGTRAIRPSMRPVAAWLALSRDSIFDEIVAIEEADGVALTEGEFAVLDAYGETPPSTRDAMFSLMRDRLDDIDDLLLQDVSPREAWAAITEERVMRRELTRELRNLANHVYTVDQEAATADEKETDIRLRATTSGQQGTTELKIGEKQRSAADLKATLKEQLLTKYMAADECRSGCLLITVASERHWNHPDTNEPLDLDRLIAFLNDEARRLMKDLGGAAKLMAKGLDLCPRLLTEKKAQRR